MRFFIYDLIYVRKSRLGRRARRWRKEKRIFLVTVNVFKKLKKKACRKDFVFSLISKLGNPLFRLYCLLDCSVCF